jgi:intraflagellar transport protein 20
MQALVHACGPTLNSFLVCLQENCNVFVTNIQSLTGLVDKYISQIDQQVEKIEAEKLRAVGLRNRVATLEEERRRKQKEQERCACKSS